MQAFDVLQNFNDTLINGDGGPLEIFLRLALTHGDERFLREEGQLFADLGLPG
jgi:hypothetical protein